MAKKSSMQKEVEETEEGEQMALIDVGPENGPIIVAQARIYKKASKARQKALKNEVEQKKKLLALIKDAGLKPLDVSGVIRFRCNSVIISVTPRDELVRVKEEGQPEEG
ncbi:MAG: hypothetical protein ABIH91_01630 [Candidatus Omnitrophota bacterium]